MVVKYLIQETTKTIVHGAVISRLDFCNGLYINMSSVHIQKLQKIMNARLVTLTPRKDHIMPVLASLHWLPIKERINYKDLITVLKALNDAEPDYLGEMLVPYQPQRALRSSDRSLLYEPRYRLTSAGYRFFEVAAPRLWNSLPADIRAIKSLDSVKRCVKTYLFKKRMIFDIVNFSLHLNFQY